MRTIRVLAVLAAAVALGACRGSQPKELPQVRVHTTMGAAAGEVLVQTARAQGVADVRLVPAEEAELFWLREPSEVIALGDRIHKGGLPPPADTDPRVLDPSGRFLPVCARGRVFVRNPRAQLPFSPKNLRDLADPRAAGRVALPALTTDEGAATIAALTLVYGEENVTQFLEMLARNQPIVTASDAEVRDRVARGDAAFGLTGSEEAAAGAASAAGLEVVVPDQVGRGAILLPTVVALASDPPRHAAEFALWLASAKAEQVLVARLPGLMPLREGTPVPVGVTATRGVRAVLVDWDRLAAEKGKVRSRLAGWPEEWLRKAPDAARGASAPGQ